MEWEVAVLGGGISGALVARRLADAGVSTVIVDRAPELMSGASRWNDGKIHLGYTFTGTPSTATAALMQHGAAAFRDVVERAIGEPLDPAWFGAPGIYLVSADSMFDAETLWGRAQAVAELVRDCEEGGQRLLHAAGQPVLERLDVSVAERETEQDRIVAAWRTSEFHVSTREIAERLRRAVFACGVEVIRAEVGGVAPIGEAWQVQLSDGSRLTARSVVNCLWESRVAVDRTVDPTVVSQSIRYKRSLFGQGTSRLNGLTTSTRIVGRYGDIVCYPNGDAYLSWYPAGLAARTDDGVAPAPPPFDPEVVIRDTLCGLGFPPTLLDQERDRWQVQGGYVVAHGNGDIDRVDSPLHARDRPACTSCGRAISASIPASSRSGRCLRHARRT